MAWRGIAIGLIISAPMGPVGMLCIQRTLDKGRRAGFYTGLGAALSDLFYSLLTGFGLSFIEEFLERNQNIIQLAGSAVLIAFGIYLFRKNPSKNLKKPTEETVSIKKSILGGFLFTFSNPLILFLTIGLFARFNFLLPEFHLWQYLTGFVFIFIGAIMWWWFITFSVDKVKSHFNIRSMWLINRIIGVIILLFAIVGIFTGVSALANGAEIKCWNAHKGFGPFTGNNPEKPNMLTGNGKSPVFFLVPCNGNENMEFRCKVRDNKVGIPWGFILKSDDNREVFIDIIPSETEEDLISSSPCLDVVVRDSDFRSVKKRFTDSTNIISKVKSGLKGPDPSGSLNFYKLEVNDGVLSLFGGLHSPEKLVTFELSDNFRVDSLGFFLYPGASISPDEIRLTLKDDLTQVTYWNDRDFLNEYLEAAPNNSEGYWQLLDRSLEESLLRMGGDYKFALVRSQDGYDLIYLEGAKTNNSKWQRGMVKARLRPSGIKNIYNVEWIDAMLNLMQNDIKAQIEEDNLITISFPYQSSQIRLIKTH